MAVLPTLTGRSRGAGAAGPLRAALLGVLSGLLSTAVAAVSPPLPVVPAATTHREPAATHARIQHCWDGGPMVWLTFDDGGSPAQVRRILRVLAAEHVRAIFFPIGAWAAANPGLISQIGAAGHAIGNHTHDHVDLTKVTERRALWQIRHGDTHARGSVNLLRPPFGDGAYSARLRSLAERTGHRLCTWTVDTRDWTGSPAATIVRRVRYGDAITPPVRAGGVVIMHMNGDHTGAALPGVIAAVRARGLTLHGLP